MSPLAHLIRREIEAHGPIAFARFMQLALYHPEWGYYERDEVQTGQGGDYFTNVSVGTLFGELLGFRFARWLEAMPDGPVHLVEAGAHDGRLAADLIGFLHAQQAALVERVEYWLLEPSPRRRARQARTLEGLTRRIRWAADWTELPPVQGVIFSNELLDAFPVHRLVWHKEEQAWSESGVAWAGRGFAWERLPGRPVGLEPALPPELHAVLPDGFVLEVSPAAVEWWRRAAEALGRGWLMTIDYGDAPGERFQPGRTEGTMRAYRRHRVSADVLQSPGKQDLTAHVDFGEVGAAGERAGLRTEGLWRQEQFLGEIVREIEAHGVGFPAWTPARGRQCRTLLHPGQLGSSFKVLRQRRGLS